MREILFRGKRTDNGEWVYGSLEISEDGLDCNKNVYYIIDAYGNGEEVIPETIGQYTGLNDKYGNKIFEGDICKGNEYSDENEIFVIKYGKYATSDWKDKYISKTCQFGWYAEFIKTKQQVHLVTPNGIRIIGNIHDGDNND